VEDESFWFQHRNDIIVRVLRRFPPGGTLFDIGGGNGCVAAALERSGFPVVLVEPGAAGARHAARRGLRQVVCATVAEAGFAPHSLPAVGLFDVIEHIEDDADFLRGLCRVMRPEGRLYVTVPAYPALWSAEDDHAGHRRRYSRKTLAAVLTAAGFEIEYLTCFFWFLPLPVWVFRTLPSRLGIRSATSVRQTSREHSAGGSAQRWLLDRLLACERGRIANGRLVPFGGSCLAVARGGSAMQRD
jgi:SAM-dependent methyltransferase